MKSAKIKELIVHREFSWYTDKAILNLGENWMATDVPKAIAYIRRYGTFYLFNPMVWGEDGVCKNADWWDIVTNEGEYTTKDIRETGDKLLLRWERGRWYK